MDTRQLEYIAVIAETGNLSAAAEKLYITQSALSQHLAKLKAEGLPPLFKEEKRKMVLTDAGKIYLNGAREILRTEQLALQKINSLSVTNKITFNFSVAPYLQSIVYVNVVPVLKRTFPDVTIHVHTNNIENTRNALDNGTIDMAFIPDIYQQRDFFSYIHIYRDELIIVSPSDKKDDNLPVTIPASDSYLRDICNRVFSNLNYNPEIYVETNDFNTSISLVNAGECKAIVPRSLIKNDSLSINSFKDPTYFYTTCIHKKTAASPVIDAAVKELKQLFIK